MANNRRDEIRDRRAGALVLGQQQANVEQDALNIKAQLTNQEIAQEPPTPAEMAEAEMNIKPQPTAADLERQAAEMLKQARAKRESESAKAQNGAFYSKKIMDMVVGVHKDVMAAGVEASTAKTLVLAYAMLELAVAIRNRPNA